MSKYQQSKESIDSSLLLWDIRPTQTSVQETYDLIVYPSAVYDDTFGGPITFKIPPQANGCLSDVEIVTEWKVMKNTAKLTDKQQVSVINNISNAMWNFVDVQVGDRVNVMQSMENAYAYQTFFNTALNNKEEREQYLGISETWYMDKGNNKEEANCLKFFTATGVKKDDIKNEASAWRAGKIKLSKVIKSRAKLQTPLLNHSKVLPSRLRVAVTLSKNKNDFLVQAEEDDIKVKVKNVYLQCTFVRPRDTMLNLQEETLKKRPALYDIDYPEISLRTISTGSDQVTINNLFPNKLPKVAFFVLQKTSDLTGDHKTSPFVFERMKSFQLYINNHEHFPMPIKFDPDNKGESDFIDAYMQLYKAAGYEYEGDCLIAENNFNYNYIIGAVFTADKQHTKHLNLQNEGETRVEIELEDKDEGPFTLITYAIYDKLYKIDEHRNLTIIE